MNEEFIKELAELYRRDYRLDDVVKNKENGEVGQYIGCTENVLYRIATIVTADGEILEGVTGKFEKIMDRDEIYSIGVKDFRYMNPYQKFVVKYALHKGITIKEAVQLPLSKKRYEFYEETGM